MTDYGLLYAAGRERISGLVRDLDDEQASITVPACPVWTVHDVVAHLAGTVTDVLAGRLDGVASDAWTAEQVEARRDVSIPALLDEWSEGSPYYEDGLRAIGAPLAGTAISDQFQHEHDIRGALDRKGGRDLEVLLTTIESYVPGLTARITEAHLPALRLEAGAHGFDAGEGAPATTLTAEPFELARLLGGRRTIDEMRGLHWEGDAEPYLPLLSAYGLPRASLGER
jgi:uncharacterized protein (TIGR03083 family)